MLAGLAIGLRTRFGAPEVSHSLLGFIVVARLAGLV
jgi:hypothetical protein